MVRIFLSILLLIIGVKGFSQKISIAGKLINENSKKGIFNGIVNLKDSCGNNYYVESDVRGNFFFDSITVCESAVISAYKHDCVDNYFQRNIALSPYKVEGVYIIELRPGEREYISPSFIFHYGKLDLLHVGFVNDTVEYSIENYPDTVGMYEFLFNFIHCEKDYFIEIVAKSSERERKAFGKEISIKRALLVKEFLLSKGIPRSRIIVSIENSSWKNQRYIKDKIMNRVDVRAVHRSKKIEY